MTGPNGHTIRRPTTALTLLGAAMLCGSSLVMAAEPKTTADGLHKIEASRVDLAYARPGADWAKYKTVQVQPLVIPANVRQEEGEAYVAVGDDAATVFQQLHADLWRAELQREGFAVVDAPRADTLIISAELTDIISNPPGAEVSGSVAIRIAMADGATRAILATASDRRFARYLMEDPTPESNLGQVRDAFRNWAHILAQELRERVEAPKVDPWLCLTERKMCPPHVMTPH